MQSERPPEKLKYKVRNSITNHLTAHFGKIHIKICLVGKIVCSTHTNYQRSSQIVHIIKKVPFAILRILNIDVDK